eukprot:1565838-Karenia_brevis.AAC.1
MPDLPCYASTVHHDDPADILQRGPLPQCEPLHYTNMCAQPNLGCDSSAMVYAPGTWEVDTMKGEALLTHHDIAIAQATSA